MKLLPFLACLGLALRAIAAEPFPVIARAVPAPLFVAEGDWPGVQRAAGHVRADLARVAGTASAATPAQPAGPAVILAGTIGRSALIDGLIAAGRLDVSAVRGRWEAFQIDVVEQPLPGVARALVVAGSDKRGTIYGLYELSARAGVSPWAWWADAPVERRVDFAWPAARQVEAGPTVKYRGIFLNDEAPALTGWANEKFGGKNAQFYAHVFELILRLRGNYLWPAMWDNAFNEDDPENPRLADEMGVVMGTSHHEPMLRAQQEWKRHGSGPWDYAKNGEVLRRFWADGVRRNRDFESLITMGMRGDGDEAMSEETNVALLERIVADQRGILREAMGRPPEQIPQLWALYKEVQAYYEHGMRVPDDVTLLWCDDNWGNIRRLPTAEERKRGGGAGVYYHFDYVGDPRNYKWLNTNPLPRVWEQMQLAHAYGADRIWIVNVGDLKPMELPIEFFLSLAWRPEAIAYDDIPAWTAAWAGRQFGPAHAAEIGALLRGYTKLNSRRKPELLAPETFSVVNYREAETVVAAWRDLAERARRVEAALPAEARAAFFQLVLHPIEASRIVNELHVAVGRNRTYAIQGRTSTNQWAETARRLFREDAAWQARWDAMLDGKWRHMMDQTHLGYTFWQQPIRNVMPAVGEVQVPLAGELGLAVEGDPVGRPGDYPIPATAKLPPLSPFGPAARWLDVFNRGQNPVSFTLVADQPWLKLSATAGTLGPDTRIEVAADWSAVPPGLHEAKLTLRSSAPGVRPITIVVPVDHRPVPAGVFVELDGHVALEAPDFSRAQDGAGVTWKVLADFGRTAGGVTTFPATAPANELTPDAPRFEYDVFFHRAGKFRVEVQVAPTFDFQPGQAWELALSLDDQPPQRLALGLHATNADWERAVADAVKKLSATLEVAAPGRHVLKLWRVSPAVVVERIVINTGGVRPSYLGPPPSGRSR